MHMKIKNMKGIDLSCASPSSTAICSSMDQRSVIKNSTKSFQRLNSYLGDHYKTLTNNNNINPYHSPPRAPCISELPFTPRPSSSSSYRDKTRKPRSEVKHSSDVITRRRRSSVELRDIKHYNNNRHEYSNSSRYLLAESRYLDSLYGSKSTRSNLGGKDNDTPSTPVFGSEGRRSTSRVETKRFGSMLDDEKQKIRQHFSLIDVSDDHRRGKFGIKQRNSGETEYDGQSQSQRQRSMGIARMGSSRSPDQVVVLRVALHCKGCEKKLRNHLSKMEGVTSYSIDTETKKVTVIGYVTPVEVLKSISKVKNAQFWPSQVSSSSNSTSTTSSTSSSSSSTIDLN
ncbi:uncharacterized protein LOC141632738 [Silene latifolia]|uniref:uncharacterized protein LOC141632738 n=1 Tax=Silene latifolia TaxID=37657 RepID=UPI003D773B7F